MSEDSEEISVFMPGYGSIDPASDLVVEHHTHAEWNSIFEDTRSRLRDFLQTRDPYITLSKTALRNLMEAGGAPKSGGKAIEQAEVEVLQALFLSLPERHGLAPPSPHSLVRMWDQLHEHVYAFIDKETPRSEEIESDFLAKRVRVQTVYYRNLFERSQCEDVVGEILRITNRFAGRSDNSGTAQSFRGLVEFTRLAEKKIHDFQSHIHRFLATKDEAVVRSEIDFLCSVSLTAERAWRFGRNRKWPLKGLVWAAYQLSELATPWAFTHNLNELEAILGSDTTTLLRTLSYRRGDLSVNNPDHIYMNNPIWTKPYILTGSDELFVPLPNLVYSFPFRIIEGLISTSDSQPYWDARAEYLEGAIAAVAASSAPSARVYRSVEWKDPVSGKTFENDVLCLIGNYIFLFEAKSGRINDGARRGALRSLRNDISSLFLDPGVQATRLQRYIDAEGPKARIWEKKTGKAIDLGLDKPKVVFCFSICMEHFTSLTSARSQLKEAGLLVDEASWAPVLSIGELQMISKFINTEISFTHYLLRRATLESEIDFLGDEQDLVSIYLTNAFWFDAEGLRGRKIVFHNADAPVRELQNAGLAPKPTSILVGSYLSPLWLQIVTEISKQKEHRNRFDMIVGVLNQSPRDLSGIEREIRRWRRGEKLSDGDIMYVKRQIGERLYVLAVHFAKKLTWPEWTERAREIGQTVAHEHDGPTDFVAVLIFRKSRERTFDGIYFARIIKPLVGPGSGQGWVHADRRRH